MPVLAELATMKNMHLWFSTDHQMPHAPAIPGVRIAYLLARDEDPARVPAGQHLVFRDDERQPLKRANGVLVCPYEQGIKRQVRITCSSCRICWTPERIKHHGQAATEEDQPPPTASRPARNVRSRRSLSPSPTARPLRCPRRRPPRPSISLEFGIDNLVAIGVVHAENKLNPQLEQQVAEIHRLGDEVTQPDRRADKRSTTKTTIDPEFEEDCKALVEAAAKLGIKLTFELVKANFNPDTLKYSVTVRFRGDMSVHPGLRHRKRRADRAARRDRGHARAADRAVQGRAPHQEPAQLRAGSRSSCGLRSPRTR